MLKIGGEIALYVILLAVIFLLARDYVQLKRGVYILSDNCEKLQNSLDNLSADYGQLAKAVDGDLNTRFYDAYSLAIFSGINESVRAAEEIIGKESSKNLRLLAIVIALKEAGNGKNLGLLKPSKNTMGEISLLKKLN